MARIARVVIPGNPHHVVQRGVRAMDVFYSDADRKLYLKLLSERAKHYGLKFWAWCLMSNHVHLVVVPDAETSMARAIGEAHRRYAWQVNMRQDVRGHLFQARFFSYPIQTDKNLLAVIRYVELNPVTAGIVSRADHYRWSSAVHHVTGKPDRLVTSGPVREMVPNWRRFLSAEVDNARKSKEIERHLKTGRPFGESSWVAELEEVTGRNLTPRKRGRKPMSP